jgi:hypothetical protein
MTVPQEPPVEPPPEGEPEVTPQEGEPEEVEPTTPPMETEAYQALTDEEKAELKARHEAQMEGRPDSIEESGRSDQTNE